ncbi:unnamed protein product [Ophioblennius macclurei]
MASVNYVGRLEQLLIRSGLRPQFDDLGSDGPDHNKTFTCRVALSGKTFPIGVGKTKKEAKQDAAQKALKCLSEVDDQDSVDTDQNATTETSVRVHQENSNYICWLNEYGQVNKVQIKPEETTRPESHGTTPYCRFVVGNKEYPMASGKTRRQAKEAAAKLVYDEINDSLPREAAEGNCNVVPGQHNAELHRRHSDSNNSTRSSDLNSTGSSFKEANYVEIINHYSQKTRLECAYIPVGRSGPPHNPRFSYKVKINGREYDEAEGRNVKEAKQKAAKLAWSALQEQSDWDSQVSVMSAGAEDDGPSESSILSAPPDLSEPSPHKPSNSTSDWIIFAKPSENSSLQDSAKDTSLSDAASNKCSSSRFRSCFDDLSPLGEGGYGQVLKARHKLLGKYYAVKIVCFKEKALREVKALSVLHHKNIVLYHDCWIEDSQYKENMAANDYNSSDSHPQYLYIQMEFCDNGTLREWIENMDQTTLSPSERREQGLPVAQQIVCGLEYIHSKNLIHRDLKPINILFGRGGEVKIGDFGLVTVEVGDDDNEIINRTTTGTQLYMAPEQISGEVYGQKVDMFALGLILLELLWKFSDNCERKQMWGGIRKQMLPKEFRETFKQESVVIHSLLSKKPEDRPTASDVKLSLEQLAEKESCVKTM